MITFSCPHCDQPLEADEAYAAMAMTCPACEAGITIPGAGAAATASAGPPPLPAAHTRAQAPTAASAAPPQLPRALPPHSPAPAPAQVYYTESSAPPSPQRKAGAMLWLLPLLATLIAPLLAVLGGTVMHPRKTGVEMDEAYRLGQMLAYASGPILFALVLGAMLAGLLAAFRLPFGRWFSRAYSVVALLLGVGVLGVSLIAQGMRSQQHQANTDWQESKPRQDAELEAVKAAYEKIRGSPKDKDTREPGATTKKQGQPPPSPASPMPSPVAAGKPGDPHKALMRQVIQEMVDDLRGMQDDYFYAQEKVGVTKLLQPDLVAKDSSFIESNRIVFNARSTMMDYMKRADEVIVSFNDRLDVLDVSEETKLKMLDAYEQGLHLTMPQFREVWTLEAVGVQNMSRLVEHLKATRLDWERQNDKFAFKNDEDLKRFQEIMDEFTSISKRQDEVRARFMDDVDLRLSDVTGERLKQ